MSDQNETLLRFRADASEVVAAAKQQQAAVKQSAAAVNELTEAERRSEEQAKRTAAAQMEAARASMSPDDVAFDVLSGPSSDAEQHEATIRAIQREADELDDLAEATKRAGNEARTTGSAWKEAGGSLITLFAGSQMGELFGRLANIGKIFPAVGKAGVAALGSIGAAAGALITGLGAAFALMAGSLAKMERIAEQAKRVHEEATRMAQERLSAEQAVGQELSKLGVGDSWKRQTAVDLASRFAGEGFDQASVNKAASFVVGGNVAMPIDQVRRLIQAVEYGDVELSGRTPVEAYKAVVEAMRKLDNRGGEQRAAENSGIAQRLDLQASRLREAENGMGGFLEDYLKSQGIRDADLAGTADAVRQVLGGTAESPSQSAVNLANKLRFDRDRIEGQARLYERRATYGSARFTPNAYQSNTGFGYDEKEELDRAERQRQAEYAWADREDRMKNRAKPRSNRAEFDPDLQNKPTQIINYNFNGVNNVGTRDPRLLRKPRIRSM